MDMPGRRRSTSSGGEAIHPARSMTYSVIPEAQESLDLAAPNTRRLAPKEFDLVQRPGDIYEAICSGAAGYGDPLERDPEAVRNDVSLGYFDLDHSVKIFGVCLAPDANGELAVDQAATTASRNSVRNVRLRRAKPPSQEAPSATITEIVFELSDSLVIGRDAKGEFYYCSAPARRALAPLEDSYKLACSRLDLPLTDAGPFVGDPHELVDDEMQFRLFVCPFTGTLIETEIARFVDPPLQDVSVDKESLKLLVNSRRKLPRRRSNVGGSARWAAGCLVKQRDRRLASRRATHFVKLPDSLAGHFRLRGPRRPRLPGGPGVIAVQGPVL